MNRALIAGTLAAIVAAVAYFTARPSDYTAQYITLPSGAKAHCNRQGYRAVGISLVTDTQGNFVECDARVGPEWDNLRTGPDGTLLTSEEIGAALKERERAAYNSPAAVAERREAQNRKELHAYELDLLGSSCPRQIEAAKTWFSEINAEERASIDWRGKRAEFHQACQTEVAAAAAAERVRQAERDQALKRLDARAAACDVPYDQAKAAYDANMNERTGDALSKASGDRSACLAPIEQALVDLEN